MPTLKTGSIGPDVLALQKKLLTAGFNPGELDSSYGPATAAAVKNYQLSQGLLADGIAGSRTQLALGLIKEAAPSVLPNVTVAVVAEMFPHTPLGNIKQNLPIVLQELVAQQLSDKPMVLMALATIRAETESFLPINEGLSRYNTSPSGHPFDLYDSRRDLGNQGPPDGANFRGRGFIQLTGRANYQHYGKIIGLGNQLLQQPELANQADIAARLLAAFLSNKQIVIKAALLEHDLKHARRLINGGSHGLDRFSEAYQIGNQLIS